VSGQAEAITGSVPLAIDIPKLGTHAQVVALGEDDDGTMQAPTDPDTVGWYQLGVGVGAPGNALLDGHVDWGGQARVFGSLAQLVPGDAIQITDATGSLLTYSVAWTRLYTADTAPLDEIFAQTDAEEITLITCGGAFDRSIRMYVSRWVVRATRVSEPERAPGEPGARPSAR
jgi:sortase (surface protein transpeptidase)